MENNICEHLRPENLEPLRSSDSLKIIFNLQEALQEKLGMMALFRNSTMKRKCDFLKDNIVMIMAEFTEMLERLPFKHWKQYPRKFVTGWASEEQRVETLFEYIDALHFFINIGLILGFTPEEVYNYYIAKNKENHKRQDRGY